MDLSEIRDLNREELLTVLYVMMGWLSVSCDEQSQMAYKSGLCEVKRQRESIEERI